MPNANEIYDIPKRRISLNFIVESSSYLSEDQQSKINAAVESSMQVLLSACQKENIRPLISILLYGTTTKWNNNQSIVCAEDYSWTGIDCQGVSNLGLALEELHTHILSLESSNPMRYNEMFPIYFFISANESTDDYFSSLTKLQRHFRFAYGTKVAYWVGKDSPPQMLEKITGSYEVVCTDESFIYLFEKIISAKVALQDDMPIQDILFDEKAPYLKKDLDNTEIQTELGEEQACLDVVTPAGCQMCGYDFIELYRCEFEGCDPNDAADVMFAVQAIHLASQDRLLVINLTGNTVWRECKINPHESVTILCGHLKHPHMSIHGDCYCSFSEKTVTIYAGENIVEVSIPIEDDDIMDLLPGEEIQDCNCNTLIICRKPSNT